MPPRNEQEYENRRQQIMEAALNVFTSKGFEKATNKDIAEAAGIASPGLIYHYFQDKADLFRQVVEQGMPVLQLLHESEALMDLPPREVLTRIAMGFMEMFNNPRYHVPFRLMLGEAMRRPAVAGMINTVGPSRAFAFLTRYLERQMELGRLRRVDAGAAARSFVGPLIVYMLSREVFTQPDIATLQPDTMVETAIEIFLRGLEPDGSNGHSDKLEA